MTPYSYISIMGRKLGLISGGSILVTKEDKREPEHIDKIRMLSFNHQFSRKETSDGLSEYPFFFSKDDDRSTPLLTQAFAEEEIIECEITLYRESPSGTQQKFFTFTLEGAVITSHNMESRPEFSGNGEKIIEHFGISYRSLSQIYHEGSTRESFTPTIDL
ncbi:type VI secretion system tube protein TssD [Pseudomonas sp. CCC3.2]|uniref:type VI secretion system tube protein TssD n=1 Tax=unclassified Pseudomonas TaxID=196821 RepID=UPI002AB4E0A9|nr:MULTISPECIES: type VI secretion system tube protein TssD [unclassified Pseudomonas]MDY7559116.1 type VI secretion system tube protein TssD [Pseudomonas sp. AB6]MEB0179906.1 type VI secretion system tube protein TssD [Pseudomonas sp. CCC3.2]MEB0209184.1 type VI secretion system tube protein TssD [Pseudomonas sp. AB6]